MNWKILALSKINGGGYPEPTGTISITANGTGIDVAQYAYADVAVPTSQQNNYLIVDDAPEPIGIENTASYWNYPIKIGIPQIAKYLKSLNFKSPANIYSDTVLFAGLSNSDFNSTYVYPTITSVTMASDFWTKYPNCVGIGSCAFTGCTQLTGQAIIPPTCKYIGSYAFSYCSQLSLSALPSDLQVIKAYAFQRCTSMFSSTLYIPASVVQLNSRCFANCTQLQTVYFDGTPTTTDMIPAVVNNSIFYGCSNITDIYVPWSEGAVAGAPWGASNATITYNYSA